LIKLENNKSVNLTIPEDRLKATHFPAIVEQVEKREQKFQVKVS
jgi:hypothetical protein